MRVICARWGCKLPVRAEAGQQFSSLRSPQQPPGQLNHPPGCADPRFLNLTAVQTFLSLGVLIPNWKSALESFRVLFCVVFVVFFLIVMWLRKPLSSPRTTARLLRVGSGAGVILAGASVGGEQVLSFGGQRYKSGFKCLEPALVKGLTLKYQKILAVLLLTRHCWRGFVCVCARLGSRGLCHRFLRSSSRGTDVCGGFTTQMDVTEDFQHERMCQTSSAGPEPLKGGFGISEAARAGGLEACC